MKKLAEYFVESEQGHIRPQVGDSVDIVVNEELAIEAGVLESTEDKLVLEYDERGISLLEELDLIDEEVNLDEEQTPSQAEAMEAGKKAARNGEKYDSNPHESGSPESIAWSVGHNVARTTMMKKEDVDLDINEGKMKDLSMDMEELTDKEFQEKYNMSKSDAKEKFNLDEAGCMSKKLRREDTETAVEEDVAYHTALDSLMHRTFGEAMKKSNAEEDATKDNFTIDDIKSLERIRDLETLKARTKELIKGRPAKRMKPEKIAFFYNRVDSMKSPIAIIKMMYDLLLAGEGHKVVGSKNSMAPNVYRQRFGEAHDANAEEDAFKELKDYAETSGGIDKEEFEKAAYLVKAMGKPHLKDKAEGMLDDLIGKMDSDPRDKVIQVLSQHIDLTFLKNLFRTEEVELDEKYDSDKFFDGKGTPEQRTQLLKLQNKALRAFPSSPKQKEIKKEIDALRKKMGMKVKEEVELDEAEYQGRKVKLGKPMRGDVAKYKVYVKDKKTGNVKKVNFGDKNMEIKRDDPKRRKSFRARHGCGTPKASDRTKARYWSCRMWSSKPVSKIV